MGCPCCKPDKEEDNLKGSEIMPAEEYSKDRLIIQGLEVRNCSPQDIKNVMCHVQVIDTKGNNPQISNQNLKNEIKKIVREEDGNLKYGQVHSIREENQNWLLLLVMPLYRGTTRDLKLLQELFENLVKLIQSQGISSICIDDVGVKYFGYPREKITQYLIEAFQVFVDGRDQLQQIYYVSQDMNTVNMFEVNLKKLNPEFKNQEPEKQVERDSTQHKSELEQPLLE